MAGPILAGVRGVGCVVEVKGVDAVCALMPPIGRYPAQHLDAGILVAVRSVVIVYGRIELDWGAGDPTLEIRQIHLKGTHAEGQQVDQLLADPALDVDPVEAAAHKRLGYGGQQGEKAARAARPRPMIILATGR